MGGGVCNCYVPFKIDAKREECASLVQFIMLWFILSVFFLGILLEDWFRTRLSSACLCYACAHQERLCRLTADDSSCTITCFFDTPV